MMMWSISSSPSSLIWIALGLVIGGCCCVSSVTAVTGWKQQQQQIYHRNHPSQQQQSNRRRQIRFWSTTTTHTSSSNAQIPTSTITTIPVSSISSSTQKIKHQSQSQQQVKYPKIIQVILDARRHLTAAAVARCTSIFIMYPADVMKTRLQMKLSIYPLNTLYKGVTTSLVGQVPYGILTFGSYEMYKSYLFDHLPNIQPIFKYAMGMMTQRVYYF